MFTFSFSVSGQQGPFEFDRIDITDGLSNNQVNSIVKDQKGFIWIGTMSGLNRYDGYNFKTFRHKIDDSTSINDDFVSTIVQGPQDKLWMLTRYGWNIYDPITEKFNTKPKQYLNTLGIQVEDFTTIIKDRTNNYWFIAPGTGLYRYNASSGVTDFFNYHNQLLHLYSNNISSVTADKQGNLFFIYSEGVLEKRDPSGRSVLQRFAGLNQYNNKQNFNYSLFIDQDNEIWIYTVGASSGIFRYDPKKNKVTAINTSSQSLRLNSNLVSGIVEDDNKNIWVATDHGGINLVNKKTNTVTYLISNESDSKSLSQNSVTTLYKDDLGIIWAGTYKKGLNHFHQESLKFPLFQHKASVANSLMYNDVNKFVEDAKGNLWIGTNGGGLIYYNRNEGSFKQYLHDPGNSNSLSNNVIVSLCIDHQQKLWIGTYFGGLDCFDGKRFINYKHDDKDPNSLADDRVWEIFEDSQHNLWVGTLNEGLDLFDRKENKFIHHRPGTGNTLRSGFVSSIIEDKAGNLWIGTALGLDRLDRKTGRFTHYDNIETDRSSLSHKNVIELLEDSRGYIWIATRDGLNLYNPKLDNFTIYRTEHGLADNSIVTIREDDQHNLWLGTLNGLSNGIVTVKENGEISLQFRNYDETDGLQGRQFNENAAFKTSKGEMIFGGANGFNIFHPSNIKSTSTPPNLVLTDFQLFNNDIIIGREYNGRVILPKSITETNEIILKFNQDVFSIGFVALNYLNSDKIRYSYKLDGFNKDWLTTDGKNRKATFTNLDPGTYQLFIRASNEAGSWAGDPLVLNIKVLPPFWRTDLAYVVYLLLILGTLLFARNIILRRAKAKFALEQERREVHRLHELDLLKIKFFTNVSHEFRTPLSLIITPVEKLIDQTKEQSEKKQFQLIHRNARRLLNLVNQLLDFRKMEEQELRLNKTTGDIVQFTREIAQSFSDIADNKHISYSIQTVEESVITDFDHEKWERILFNLLSNAFKFTVAGGKVNVYLGLIELAEKSFIRLKITDTGIGIEKEKQEKIFERFFQNEVPGSMVNQGSGIGLSITKEFVKLHHGEITVESEPGKGSSFIVVLPLESLQIESILEPAAIHTPIEEAPIQKPADRSNGARNKKKTLLLVEDNEDFRFYIKDNLKNYYNVIEAENGRIGWNKTLAGHPDLIVSDISMPEMDGIEFCKKVKTDKRTSFIPVILLTALTGEEQQLSGLQTGASDYMTKPFNFEILLSKIRNLLSETENFKKTYQKQVQVQVSEVVMESAEEKFMQQLLMVMEKNISNPAFSVEMLSREMYMSRVALYKKLFNLTGKTPIEFIRHARLQRACQLLEKTTLSIAEVAYEVGFNNPKKFSQYFKEEFQVLPSAYRSDRPASSPDNL